MFLLANKWDGRDPTGWLVSTKLDGYRAIWDGKKFISRNSNVIDCPSWFTRGFPKEFLDGELWAGNGGFETVASVVKGSCAVDWKKIIYAVFDAPHYDGIFEERIRHAELLLGSATFGFVIPFWKCTGKRELLSELDEVVSRGGEGLMLRKPGSRYEGKRSGTLLKVKKWFSDEAVIIGHIEGTRPGLCGALLVVNRQGKIFKIASGLTEEMAHNPPPLNTIITYKYELLSRTGIPRPATFLKVKVLK